MSTALDTPIQDIVIPDQAPRTLTAAHEQWATRPADERFKTLEELSSHVKARMQASREQVTSIKDVSVAVFEDGLRVMTEGNEPGAPSNWSFGQLAGAVNFRASELRKLSPETAAIVVNEQIDRNKDQQIKVMRVIGDESDDIIQAVTSPSYGRIFDSEVVDMVQGIVDLSDGKFHNPMAYSQVNGASIIGQGEPEPAGLYASDRDVFMFMIDGGSVFDEGPRAQFNRGFIVSNSEVGKSSLVMMSFLFNVVCGNHYIWGASGINMKRIIHSSGAPGRFASNAFDELKLFAKTPMDFAPVQAAMTIQLTAIRPGSHDFHTERDKWIRAFSEAYGFTGGEVKEAINTAIREEGKCDTAWDLCQGFTAAARSIPHIDTRINLEQRAGKFLSKLV
jgi:hypothetical protein